TACRSESRTSTLPKISRTASVRPEESAPLFSRRVQSGANACRPADWSFWSIGFRRMGMKRLSIVVSLPGENNYLREQEAAARTSAQRLGIDLQVINAKSDPITQSQQVLKLVQAQSGRPD